MGLQPEIPEREYRPIHPEPGWRSLARKIWAPIAVLIGLVLKFGFAFAKFASIFVAVGGYALIWGWQFGVGFVLLIFVHELGHFVEARRRGFNAAWPVFIPFLGAYVAIRYARMNPWQSFWIARSLDALERRFDRIDGRLDRIDERLDRIIGDYGERIARLEAG